MSQSSASRTLKYIQRSATYSAVAVSPQGDIFQLYEDKPDGSVAVYPDWEAVGATKPEILMNITSSRSAQAIVPSVLRVYVNDVLVISESQSQSTDAIWTKIFDTVNGKFGVRIDKNLVTPYLRQSVNVRLSAGILFDSTSVNLDWIDASYTVRISEGNQNTTTVTIAAGDTKNFNITEKGGSCILKALVYHGGTEQSPSAYTYTWEKLVSDAQGGTAWQTISGQTGQTLTVYGDDIDTFAQYRVNVYHSSTLVGRDIQGVMDTSDPYVIEANPNPADETIYDEGTRDHVTYTPAVYKRGASTAETGWTFTFAIHDSAGNILTPDPSDVSTTACTIRRAVCIQGGGDIAVDIFATK